MELIFRINEYPKLELYITIMEYPNCILKVHAITLRKQGWTEFAISRELDVPRSTIRDWLISVFSGENATMGKTAKSWVNGDNRKRNNPAKKPQFKTFLGKLEDFETNIRFPLIIADPPYNLGVN